MVRRNKSHAAHIGSQCINFLHATSSLKAIVPPSQVEQLEFVGIDWAKLWILDINATHPITLLPQVRNQMVVNEPTSACDQDLGIA